MRNKTRKDFDKKDVLHVIVLVIGFIICMWVIIDAIAKGSDEKGMASYYAEKYHGRQTASGEIFNTHDMTAAHKKLPFGTKIKVTNIANGKSVIVRVNDRGPFVKGRIVDLTYAAAQKIDIVKTGVAKVTVEIIEKIE